MLEIKEILAEKDYHPETIVPNVPITQTWWYGELQKKRGRVVRRFDISEDGDTKLLVQFIEYQLMGKLNYWYAAYGPVIKDNDEMMPRELDKALRSKGSANTVFIRLDFTPKVETKVFTKVSKTSGSGSFYQPRYEWYTDISGSSDQILMAMHQKTRYSVRLAEKKGVTVEIINGININNQLQSFMSLMRGTAKRNNFTLHDEVYYQTFFDEVASRGNGFLILAKHHDDILAVHLVVLVGKVAHYVFGATSDKLKELCAPYLAHWGGMLEGKKRGATIYNFGGISEQGSAPHWESITVFKKKFGGYTHPHSQYYDVVLKSFWYHLYNFRKWLKGIKN